jgi:outer membrane protein assembly factor BamD
MKTLPLHLQRTTAWLVVGLGLASVLPALGAQRDAPLEPRVHENEKLERGRGRVFGKKGFRGLTPEDAQAAQKLLDQGEAYEKSGRIAAALGQYKRVYKKYPRGSAAPEAMYRSAKIYVKEKDPQRAFDLYDSIIRAYPDFGHYNELISEEYRIAYDMVKGRSDKKMLGLFTWGAGRERGIAAFERLVFNAPYSDYAPLALMNIAETYLDMGTLESAIYTLDRLITNYPNSIVTPDGYLRMAQVQEKLVDGPLYDQGATRESINHYEDFLILFPNDPNVGTAEQGLARMKEMMAESRMKMADFYYYKRSRYTAAKVFYNEAITIAPTSDAAQKARERLARLEVDEAAYQAKVAAQAGKPQRNRFFGLFRKAKTVEPIVLPDDPKVKAEEEAKKPATAVKPGSTVEAAPAAP